MRKGKQILYTNRYFKLAIILYCILLTLISCIAIFYSYREKKNEYLNKMNITLNNIENQYNDVVLNFWEIYMPIFEDMDFNYRVLVEDFFSNDRITLLPQEKNDLNKVLKQILLRDDRIKWVAVYRNKYAENYILFPNQSTVQKIDSDFPFIIDIENKKTQMQVFCTKPVEREASEEVTFAISGGLYRSMGQGHILVGYDVNLLEQYCTEDINGLVTNYVVKVDTGIVLNNNNVEFAESYQPSESYEGLVRFTDNKYYYVNSIVSTGNLAHTTFYCVSWSSLFFKSISTSLYITVILLIFTVLSLIIYFSSIKAMSRKVEIVKHSLFTLGNNDLKYRIKLTTNKDEFFQIYQSINFMADKLQDNIYRMYLYQLKQKEAELSEIQSKFNPHFLYNYLELLREKVYSNGDVESAEIITSLSSIFRGLLSTKKFVTLQEEVSFCNNYFLLFQTKFTNDIDFVFNIDTEIAKYGIIRNLLHPIIENYFVHAYDNNEPNNYLSIEANEFDNDYIDIKIEDNGLGMSEADIAKLYSQFSTREDSDGHYGIQSVYKRIKLFYGEKCGINIINKDTKGIIVSIRILKLTIDDLEKKFNASISLDNIHTY